MIEDQEDKVVAPVIPEKIPGLIEEDFTQPRIYQGYETAGDTARKKAKAEDHNSVLGNMHDAFVSGDNFGASVYGALSDADEGGPVDPTWRGARAISWADANPQIPLEQRWRYLSASNEKHAELILDRATRNQQLQAELEIRDGMSPAISSFLASVVDIDIPIAIAGGALSKGGRMLATLTKAQKFLRVIDPPRLARGAIGGGATFGSVGAINYATDPNAEWAVVPTMGVLGAAIGLIVPGGGKIAKQMSDANKKTMDHVAQAIDEPVDYLKRNPAGDAFGFHERALAEREAYDEAIANPPLNADGTPMKIEPKMPFAVAVDKIEASPIDADDLAGSTVGSKQFQGVTEGIGLSNLTAPQQAIIAKAKQELGASGAEVQMYDDVVQMEKKYGKVGVAASRLKDAMQSTWVQSNFHKLFRPNSAVAKLLATKMYTNPEGIIRNQNAADAMMRQYEWDILTQLTPFHDGFTQFVKDTYPAAGHFEKFKNQLSHRDAYHREVLAEGQARMYDPPGTVRNIPKYIKDAADARDAFWRKEIEQANGLHGESARFGWKGIRERAGYSPQQLNANKVNKVLTDLNARFGKNSRKMLNTIIAKAYMAADPNIALKDAMIWGTATVDNALLKDTAGSTNLVGILMDGGPEALFKVLERNGVSKNEANRLIDTLINRGKEKGREGHLKRRLDIDLRGTIDGVHMMDLFDTDLLQQHNRRGRQSAGMAAMARIGIDSRKSMNEMKDTILAEQQARGRPVARATVGEKVEDFLDAPQEITGDDIDAMFSYFTGDPITGGMSPAYSRIRKITGLSLLNQLGLTSAGEFGVLWSAYGMTHFLNELPAAIKQAWKDKGSPLVEDLHRVGMMVPEERLRPDGGQYELDRLNISDVQDFAQKVDNGLNQALHLQAKLSGFNLVRRVQQNMAAHLFTARLFEGVRGKAVTTRTPFSPERLRDIGVESANDTARINRMAQAATFDASGRFEKIDFSQWTDQDMQWYKRRLYNAVDKYVHLARAGETSYWFHKDGLASLFFHLKSFPLTAMAKQAYRNARIGDEEAVHAFLFGLATSGMIYGARQVINGRPENLEPMRLVEGALNYSNFTGWGMMWSNPLMQLMGVDAGDNGRGSDGIFAVPAAFSVLQRLSDIPGIPGRTLLNGGYTNRDIRALQAMPIVGNIYGAPVIWNALKPNHNAPLKAKKVITEDLAPEETLTPDFTRPK
jgi:hypothetical protein